MVVAHGACEKQLLRLLQGFLARGRCVTRQGQRAERKRAEERNTRLAANLDSLFYVGERLFRRPARR